jgi:hypothetical protein
MSVADKRPNVSETIFEMRKALFPDNGDRNGL